MAIDFSKPVRVFKNPKLGCYNIMQGGLIKATARQIRLSDAEFLVRESGRQLMLKKNRRTIHAYIQGHLVDFSHPNEAKTINNLGGRQATYNPYRFASFVDRETEAPLSQAPWVQLDEHGVTYSNAA
jgi:hypothetical protein